MHTVFGLTSGKDWEEHCHKILHIRYIDDFQEIAAQNGGDYGIDGYTRTGITFQCYCPDDDLTGRDLYVKQRDKITKDIKKLINNSPEISNLIGHEIHAWHFLTPKISDKALNEHLRTKEDEIRNLGSSHFHTKFTALIHTETTYARELQQLLGLSYGRIFPQRTPEEFLLENLDELPQLAQVAEQKFSRLENTPKSAKEMAQEILRDYADWVYEQNSLLERFPHVYEAIRMIVESSERRLTYVSSVADKGNFLKSTLNELEEKLRTELKNNLSEPLISKISAGTLADWVVRCPINF
ncbi:MAG: hypothetical protein KQJ78_14645 [Deltaproteobacteria bacterium]|nr:hypothetical protein [Deltaproteobacteria bacterium]